MSEQKKGGRFLARPKGKAPGKAYAIPFFVVLFALTIVAFIIPLRPTQSVAEKRNLAKFPEFTWEAFTSGDYFDDINLWFSDTFPGRDGWISLSNTTSNFHGISDVVIYGDIGSQETIPDEFQGNDETRPPELDNTDPSSTPSIPEDTTPIDTTPPTTPVEEWGGVNAGEGADIYLGSVIQIGDTAFNYFGYSQNESERFVNTMTWFNEFFKEREDVNILLTLIPTSVGVMVESEYQEKIGCGDQGKAIEYIFSGIPEDIIKVDIFPTLVEHNDEYIYFRTDHHWTALGGYYCYRDVITALGREPAELTDFEEWDQGTFQGSNYWKANQATSLKLDTVTAYNPVGDIKMIINNENGRFSWPILTDMSSRDLNTKYMTFLAGDHPLCEITNNDLPEDAGTCVIIKDSYGNCVAPFFVANYHKVYVVDFREYRAMNMRGFIDAYGVDDVIFLIPVAAAQDRPYNNMIRTTCGF